LWNRCKDRFLAVPLNLEEYSASLSLAADLAKGKIPYHIEARIEQADRRFSAGVERAGSLGGRSGL